VVLSGGRADSASEGIINSLGSLTSFLLLPYFLIFVEISTLQ
jgi:hypothetical protein